MPICQYCLKVVYKVTSLIFLNMFWIDISQKLIVSCVVQINNAGSIMSQRDVNVEGLEKSFATNVLGESNVWLRFEENIKGKETWGLVMKSVFIIH